jgi:hypothetical protein
MPRTAKSTYTQNGVYITPGDFTEGDRVRLSYEGLLARSGATELFAHVGYGTQKWENIADIKMARTPIGFEATFPVTSTSNLNVVFKDSANNWDNNSGKNYTFKIK